MRGKADRGKAKDQDQQPKWNGNRSEHGPNLADPAFAAMPFILAQISRGCGGWPPLAAAQRLTKVLNVPYPVPDAIKLPDRPVRPL